MRNWMLTPAVVVSLASGSQALNAAPGPNATDTVDPAGHQIEDRSLVLAGARLEARQLGPLDERDAVVSFALRLAEGEHPLQLAVWLGDEWSPSDQAELVDLSRDRTHTQLVTLELPTMGSREGLQLWVEVLGSDGRRARGAFHLLG